MVFLTFVLPLFLNLSIPLTTFGASIVYKSLINMTNIESLNEGYLQMKAETRLLNKINSYKKIIFLPV